MITLIKTETRDLEADRDLVAAVMLDCAAAGKKEDEQHAAAWVHAIDRALAAERENDKLREENAMLLEQLQQHRSTWQHHADCYD